MNVERETAIFNRWAGSYDRSPWQLFLFGPTHREVLEAAGVGPDPATVLDVGCGTALLLERAAGRWPGATLVGIDLSPEMIAQAQRKHAGDPRFTFEVGDAKSLAVEASSIDLAVSTISFHHWDDQPGGVREVARVLRPGGLFILADARPPRLLEPLQSRLHGSRSRERLFQQAGLTVVGERRPLRLARSVLITVGRKDAHDQTAR
jgi:ubiquinone/menaquinone biosynthesis C-methylase UbiE